MPSFVYTAIDSNGKRVAGCLEGKDVNEAKKNLKAKNCYVVRVVEKTTSNKLFFTGVRREDLVISIQELATLINSGIALDECFTAVILQMKESRLKQVYIDIQMKIREGSSFSNAINAYPQYFSDMMVSMVKAGEESGALDLILSRIADFLEKRMSFRNRIIGIMTYPILMAIVAILVLVFILSFVAPMITKIFKEIAVSLPVPTIILINVSNFFKSFWIWIVGKA